MYHRLERGNFTAAECVSSLRVFEPKGGLLQHGFGQSRGGSKDGLDSDKGDRRFDLAQVIRNSGFFRVHGISVRVTDLGEERDIVLNAVVGE